MKGGAMCMITAIVDLKAVRRRALKVVRRRALQVVRRRALAAANTGKSGEPHNPLDRKLIGQKET
jgi:hypothetical protein